MWWAPTSMKKIMTVNGLFVLGRPETQLHDILWAVHDRKNRGRSKGEENMGEFLITVGGRGPSDARFSHRRTRVGARCWALIEPERLHCRLRITDPSDRSMAVN